ncbi:MAG: NEL-type E3 ubiquitin ligase domain-containing protein [Pseudomonadota bacterium]
MRNIWRSVRHSSSSPVEDAGASQPEVITYSVRNPIPTYPPGRLRPVSVSRRLQADTFSQANMEDAAAAAAALIRAGSEALSNTVLTWSIEPPEGERANRSEAANRIRQTHLTNATTLDLHGLGLSSLPDCLDMLTSVNKLLLGANQLSSLPSLPSSLRLLDLRYNRFVSASTIPASLQLLSIDGDGTHLPGLLPEHRQAIARLQHGPAEEQVAATPMTLPPPASPQMSLITQKRATFTSHIPTIVLRFRKWEPAAFRGNPAVETKWIKVAQHRGAAVFAEFLENLFYTGEYRDARTRPAMEKRVIDLMHELYKSSKLRKTCFAIATEASESCEDRVALALNDMSLALVDRLAEKGRYTEADLLDMGRGLFRLHILDGLAAKHVVEQEKRYAANPILENKVDPIEVRLAFHTMLAEQLSLPGVAREMKYLYDSKLEPADLDEAVHRITLLENTGAHVKHLVTWSPWVKVLQQHYPHDFADFEKRVEQDRDWLVFQPAAMNTAQYIAAGEDQKADDTADRVRFMVKLTWQHLSKESAK